MDFFWILLSILVSFAGGYYHLYGSPFNKNTAIKSTPAKKKEQPAKKEAKKETKKESSKKKNVTKSEAKPKSQEKPKDNASKKLKVQKETEEEESKVESDDEDILRLAVSQGNKVALSTSATSKDVVKSEEKKKKKKKKSKPQPESEDEDVNEDVNKNVNENKKEEENVEDDDGFEVVVAKKTTARSKTTGGDWGEVSQTKATRGGTRGRGGNTRGGNTRGRGGRGGKGGSAPIVVKKKVRTAFKSFPAIPRKTRGKERSNFMKSQGTTGAVQTNARATRRASLAKYKTNVLKIQNQNNAVALSSSGSARVDFFFKAIRGVNPDLIQKMLTTAWKESPLDTLKLIFQARDARGGKGEKALFYGGLRWLGRNHPEVFKINIKHIPFFGTWKDMLCLMGSPFEKDMLQCFANQLIEDLNTVEEYERKLKSSENTSSKNKKNKNKNENKNEVTETKVVRPSISLCAKWAPTENQAKDVEFAARKLAKLLTKDKNPMKVYRKKITLLRNFLKVTETYMCAKEWDKIEYSNVASRCMNRQRNTFRNRDAERFNKFLEDVKSGKKTIKGAQMFPHELVVASSPYDEVVEQQWKVIVKQVMAEGSLKHSLVLSDVSGSMSGTPMDVSIALGLLISEVTEEPFKNQVITFSDTPKFHTIEGDSLEKRVNCLRRADAGMSTNFLAVFDLILRRAAEYKIPVEQMPKRIFVISDMQFNEADNKYATNHKIAKEKYSRSPYPMPQIIYWNVRADTPGFPVSAGAKDVAMVAGYSPSIMKVFMSDGEMNPLKIMKDTIDAERYKILTLK